MVKNKAAAQVAAIIILSLVLVSTLVFSIVYVYINSDKIHKAGEIELVNLEIDMYSTHSSKYVINFPDGINVSPNTELNNTAMYIENNSNVNVYLAVVYKINAVKLDDNGNEIANGAVTDSCNKPFLDLNMPFYNIESGVSYMGTNLNWIDFVFVAESGDAYRCFISTRSYVKTTEEVQEIEVIGTNKLRLHGDVGNEYQQSKISMTFQAFSINSSSFSFSSITNAEQCNLVMQSIYQREGSMF